MNDLYLAEFKKRIKLIRLLDKSPSKVAAIKLHYKNNPIDFINDWCVTHDPRDATLRLKPFILYPIQEQYVKFLIGCIFDKANGITDKSRDMGATYVACAVSLWLWLFHANITIGWGSRKEEYVDRRGDLKAIFPKIRQMINYLPKFLLPKGFSLDTNAPHMRILNTENGSSIIGESGFSLGRGGRTTVYFKDEAAFYEQPELIEAALGDNTDVQIDISTFNGTNNIFYRRAMSAEIWQEDKLYEKGATRRFILDWRDHPLKTQEWYEMRRKKAENEGLMHLFAQEVDRDPTGSQDCIIIKQEWVKSAIDAHIKLGFGEEGERIAGQDVADEGGDKNALIIRKGVILRHASHWGGDAGEAAKVAVPVCIENSVNYIYYDSIGVGAGFKTGINNIQESGGLPKSIRVMPWNAGSSPIDPDDHIIEGDFNSPTNVNQYANLKSQSWWRLRTRFYKTWRAIVHGEKYSHDELISLDSTLPLLHQLCNELSQANYKYNSTGKVLVDKKPDGAKSPNLADATVICYNPNRSVSILDVL